MVLQSQCRAMGGSLTAATLLLCLAVSPLAAQVFSPSQDAVATVRVLTGRVNLMRDSVPWALSVGDTVRPRQVVVTGPDGYALFQVADGSTFEVFPNSHVIFRDNFGDWRDLVDVWIGRIKVRIQKMTGGQPNVNRVNTPTAVISVKGTVFHVAVEDEGGTTFVLVEEGLVTVKHKRLPGKEIPLNPGESIRVLRNEPLAMRMIDKGTVAHAATRAVWEAVYQVLINRRAGGGAAPPTTGGAPADQKAPDPPPPPPPPPPPQ